jgi:hypothetical protein
MLNPTVFELRDYTCRPGRRDDLVAMFERLFLDPLEAGGSHVAATFRDLDQDDRWLWIRCFESMATRKLALRAFYNSALWLKHRAECNATIMDSDNVLLLRLHAGDTLREDRAAIDATAIPRAVFALDTYFPEDEAKFAAAFETHAMGTLSAVDAAPLASFVTEHAENNYKRLPIRAGETVFVTLTRFASQAAHKRARAALAASPDWAKAQRKLAQLCIQPSEHRRLQATPRSSLR